MKQTTCRSVLTCCSKTPEKNIFAIEDPKDALDADDEGNMSMQSPLKKIEMSSKRKGGNGSSPMKNENDVTAI